jgi:hypothetical protein
MRRQSLRGSSLATLACVLAGSLALSACATPPARYDAFAGGMAAHASGVARQAERVRQLPWPARPDAAVAAPDCRNMAELAPGQRERCAVERRMAVTALVNRHAQALAEYAAALAILGTRVDASPAMEALAAARGQAIALGARCLWQQIGVVNQEADQLVRQAGMDSVMNRCVKIEHGRLFGGLNLVGVSTGIISAKRRLSKA